jgi:hypothetical protein
MVLPDSATDEQFNETEEWLNTVDWMITDTVVGVNTQGAQVVELVASPTGVLTVEALSGAQEQLAELAKL